MSRQNTGPTDLSRLDTVRTYVEEILTEGQVPGKDIRRFCIAFDEIFSNICHYSKAGKITVECSIENDRAILVFEDDGMTFNPLERTVPDIEEQLEQRKAGGLGIYMVRELMDAVTYERVNEKNRLTIAKQI